VCIIPVNCSCLVRQNLGSRCGRFRCSPSTAYPAMGTCCVGSHVRQQVYHTCAQLLAMLHTHTCTLQPRLSPQRRRAACVHAGGCHGRMHTPHSCICPPCCSPATLALARSTNYGMHSPSPWAVACRGNMLSLPYTQPTTACCPCPPPFPQVRPWAPAAPWHTARWTP
jgi:hypothetical protein